TYTFTVELCYEDHLIVERAVKEHGTACVWVANAAEKYLRKEWH
ncbi:unnamed protein product, partial [marine sediment metagenome]